MKDLVHARVVDHLSRLRLGHVAERIDALLSDAAKKDVTYLDFLDGLLSEELASKKRKRIAMHVQIAHFPVVKTLEDFVSPARGGGLPELSATAHARRHEDQCRSMGGARGGVGGERSDGVVLRG